VNDGHGSTTTQDVVVTITGTNDNPVINSAGTTATGAITEIADGAPGENTTTLTSTGTIAFSDVDLIDTHTATVTPLELGYLGSLTLGAVNQAGDTVGWSFSVADSALDSLAGGQVLTQTYTVNVDDGHGGTATQNITVTLTGTNDAPVITSDGGGATASISIAENSSAVTTVHATDVDSASLTYSIVGGADASKFTINAQSGALSFVNAPDFETPTDSDHNNTYLVQVQASDGTASDLQSITVNVTNVNEGDTQGPAGVKFDFNFAATSSLDSGNGLPTNTQIGTFTAVGDPNSTSFTYQLQDTDASHDISSLFSISSTGVFSTAAAIGAGTYTFNVIAIDQAGNASPATPITVWVGTTNGDGTSGSPIVLSTGTDLGFGLNGGDVINGSGGDDVILGGQQNDLIDGGAGKDILIGGAGDDTFIFHKGEASGDRVSDFEGANANNGDTLRFVGYGAGATLTHLSGDDWQITFTGGTEVIKLTGITSLDPSKGDYQFV
jgi:VCBS repeat-containing protein